MTYCELCRQFTYCEKKKKKNMRKAYCEKILPMLSRCFCILGFVIWFSKLVQMHIC